jgi:hypothetical protein
LDERCLHSLAIVSANSESRDPASDAYSRHEGIQQVLGKFDLTLEPSVRQLSEEEQLDAIYKDASDTGLEEFEG